MEESSKIVIHLLEGNAFVWNVEDARKIREKHGLVGKLVGALVRKPRQNIRLGLPLELLPEETRVLVEIGAATLVRRKKQKGHEDPSDVSMESSSRVISVHEEESVESLKAEAEAYKQFLQKTYEEQRRMALEEKRHTLESMSENTTKDRKKRRRLKESKDEPMESSSRGPNEELQKLEDTFHFPEESTMVQIPTACTSIDNVEEVDLGKASPDWPYTGQKHELRYKVFRDLWQKGYYLTSGNKFGGDFLVYPGDPMRFHAHYIAICFPQEDEIALSDIVTAGRLGTNVKKTILMCSSNKEGLVTYTSLQWSGLQ